MQCWRKLVLSLLSLITRSLRSSMYFPSQKRYRCIKCKTSRYSRSFVPVTIRMLNAKWVILMSLGWIVLVVDTSGNSFAFLLMTIPYILYVIMSCKMHILFKDNKVIWFEVYVIYIHLKNTNLYIYIYMYLYMFIYPEYYMYVYSISIYHEIV